MLAASEVGDVEVVKKLLKAGAEVNYKDRVSARLVSDAMHSLRIPSCMQGGNTPFYWALRNGYKQVAVELFKACTEIESKDQVRL